MARDVYLYIGPYAEVTERIVSREVDNCRKPDECPQDKVSQYCPRCGLSANVRFRTLEEREKNVDLAELTQEVLTYGSPTRREGDLYRYTLIPNVRRPGSAERRIHPSHEDVVMDLAAVDAKAEVTWFRETFAEELEAVERAFGNLVIHWGALTSTG